MGKTTSESPGSLVTTPLADRVRVRIQEEDFEMLRDHMVRGDGLEYAAYLLAGVHHYEDGGHSVLEYLVRDVIPIDAADYTEQSAGYVSIDHETQWSIIQDAKGEGPYVDELAVLFAHSHPWSPKPGYSPTDNRGEKAQMQPLTATRQGPHGSIIFGSRPESLAGRVWSTDPTTIRKDGVDVTTPIDEVVVQGPRELRRFRTSSSRLEPLEGVNDRARDRQALMHGPEGNERLREAHVAIVGAGGLGSLIVQQLANLGIGTLTIVDPDIVETTNLSRIAGASPDNAGPASATPEGEDVVPAQWADTIDKCGYPKVDVMEDFIHTIDTSIDVRPVREEAQHVDAIESIRRADLIVTATDTYLSRRTVSNAAQQYMRPLIDAGVAVDVSDESVRSITTRVSMAGSGRRCLDCQGVIVDERVQAEAGEDVYGMDPDEGEHPAVVTVNSEPAHRVAFAVHRYLTGLWSDRDTSRAGRLDMAADARVGDPGDEDPACPFCGPEDGSLWAVGDRGPSIGADLSRRSPPTSPIKTKPPSLIRRFRQSLPFLE